MAKLLKDLLEEIAEEELQEAKGDIAPDETAPAPAPLDGGDDLDDDDDEDKPEEKISDHAADGKGHYTPDDLREIIDYVYDVLEKELDEPASDEDGDDNKKDDIGEIGLDLIYEYADLLPETVINQIVDDLKDIFEIEDTMLEGIISEGSAFFSKGKGGPGAKAARQKMREYYRKNKSKIKKRNTKWRNSDVGKKMAALHKKIMKGVGKMKGKRLHAQGV